MECYEGATMIKTFRGQIADGAQDTILLHTNDGSTGYRIVKFQIIGVEPGEQHSESTVKIYKIEQTLPVDNAVDFSDQTLLAVAYYQDAHDVYTDSTQVIFDHEIFNQDIYVTHEDTRGTQPVNYYLELEQIKLDINSNTVATLKDMRNTATPNPG